MKTQCPHCESPLTSESQRFCYRCGYDLSAEKASESAEPQAPQIEETTSEISDDISAKTVTDLIIEPGSASLRIILPTGDVFDRDLRAGETTIGKGPRNDVVVSDTSVSTSHAVIYTDADGFSIKDLGSKNGTFIDGERLTLPHRLRHGDVIAIGRSRITFRLQSRSETAVLSLGEFPANRTPTEKDLAAAIAEAGWATSQQIESMVAAAGGKRLASLVIAKKLATEEALRDLMNQKFGTKTVTLDNSGADETVVRNFPAALALQKTVYPLKRTNGSLLLAVFDPTDQATFDAVRNETGLQVEVGLATAGEIKARAFDRFGARLVGVLPSGERIERIIDLPDIEIGKALHNHVVLHDPTVSNSHAIILARDGAYSIVDLSSTNGTFVSGERLGAQAKTLRHGDTIQIGTTVLTFRNPSETPENITAILPPNVAEEVRRRAATVAEVAPPAPGLVPQPIPPPIDIAPQLLEQPAAVVESTVTPDESPSTSSKGQKSAKKNGKKKKGKDDRIRAAYVTALGRILAAALSVALTVALALYIRDYGSGTDKGKIETSKKGKPKLKVNGSGQETPFQGGTFEASGVVQVPGSNTVLFVDDNRPGQVLWMELDETGKQKGDIKPVDLGVSVDDPENITYGGSFFYMVSSQSNPDADSNSLIRFVFDPSSGKVVGKPDVIPNMRSFLIDNVDQLKADGPKSAKDGGLNIEGMAWDPNRERLLLGLRSPLANEQAIVIPIRLKDPHGAFSLDNLQVEAQGVVQMSLGGLGIRDIQYDPQLKAFHVIAGEPQHHDKKTFALWEWDGNGGKGQAPGLTQEMPLEPKMKPEGVCRVSIGQHSFIFIVGDASAYIKLDYAADE